MDVVNWRKSSRSGGNGAECVEVGQSPGVVAVRDTQGRRGPVTSTLTGDCWRKYPHTKRQNTASCRNVEARRNQRRGRSCAAKPCKASTQQKVNTPAASTVIQ